MQFSTLSREMQYVYNLISTFKPKIYSRVFVSEMVLRVEWDVKHSQLNLR